MRKIKLTEKKKKEEKDELKKIKKMVFVKSLSDDLVNDKLELSNVFKSFWKSHKKYV